MEHASMYVRQISSIAELFPPVTIYVAETVIVVMPLLTVALQIIFFVVNLILMLRVLILDPFVVV
jgi:hypothetical protein